MGVVNSRMSSLNELRHDLTRDDIEGLGGVSTLSWERDGARGRIICRYVEVGPEKYSSLRSSADSPIVSNFLMTVGRL